MNNLKTECVRRFVESRPDRKDREEGGYTAIEAALAVEGRSAAELPEPLVPVIEAQLQAAFRLRVLCPAPEVYQVQAVRRGELFPAAWGD